MASRELTVSSFQLFVLSSFTCSILLSQIYVKVIPLVLVQLVTVCVYQTECLISISTCESCSVIESPILTLTLLVVWSLLCPRSS